MTQLQLKHQCLDLTHPQVMGILNVTTDSFSDGGLFIDHDLAKKQAERMLSEGASIIDVGGESTRPGAAPVSEQEELDRVIPIIEWLSDITDVSIDTSKAIVMTEAIKAGAAMVNDVCALQNEGALAAVAEHDVPVCLMHMQGTPRTMQADPTYVDVVTDIMSFFTYRIAACEEAGIGRERLILDPGFGFGKTATHNVALLNRLRELQALELPVLAGLSRKSLIAEVIDKPAHERMAASVALAIKAWQEGAAIIRVHDVAETVDALRMLDFVKTTD
ncbi:MAG: dihydropteroate synthase [Gammaproteobacteria bacterium]